MAGVAIMFFYGLVVKSISPDYTSGGTGTLTPYTAVFFFAVGILISTPIFNTFAMHHPVSGNKVTMSDYLSGDAKTHLVGILGRHHLDGRHGHQLYGFGRCQSRYRLRAEQCRASGRNVLGRIHLEGVQICAERHQCAYHLMFLLFIAGLVLITMSNG